MEYPEQLLGIFSKMRKNLYGDDITQYFLFVDAMDAIANYFTLRTESILPDGTRRKHQCASCIKIFAKHKKTGQTIIKTFCRDTVSKRIRGLNDGLDPDDVFSVDSNTAFFTIVKRGEPYFFSNDLLAEPNYKNERQGFERDYRSAVVVPILGMVPSKTSNKMPNVEVVLGFLAVDSKDTDVFDKEDTVDFLTATANALFRPLYYFSSPSQDKPQTQDTLDTVREGN